MNKNWEKVLVFVMSILFVFAGTGQTYAGTVFQKSEVEEYLDALSESQMSANPDPGYGSAGGEWLILALARYGSIREEYKNKYLSNLKTTLDSCNGVLSKRKYTEYSRVVLALTALGENAENFHGYNLVRPLAEYDKVVLQGANGLIYTLIALDAGNYNIPLPPAESTSFGTTREKLIQDILNAQTAEGGWSFSGKNAASDVTAMAIQALIPYIDTNNDVRRAVDKGVEALGKLQLENGGYADSGTENCESTAQVLTAMSELGISITDKRFVKNGKTVLDGLMEYYKDGGFSHLPSGKKNPMATEQAMYALVSYDRFISEKKRLYDMSDGLIYRIYEETEKNTANGKETIRSEPEISSEYEENVSQKLGRKKNRITSGSGQSGEKTEKRSIEAGTENIENTLDGETVPVKEEITSADETEQKKGIAGENILQDESHCVKSTEIPSPLESNASDKHKTENRKIQSPIKVFCGVLTITALLCPAAVWALDKRKKQDGEIKKSDTHKSGKGGAE